MHTKTTINFNDLFITGKPIKTKSIKKTIKTNKKYKNDKLITRLSKKSKILKSKHISGIAKKNKLTDKQSPEHKTHFTNNEIQNISNEIENINNIKDDEITIRYMSKRFYTNTKTARRVAREPLVKNKFGEFLDDNIKKLIKGGYITGNDLNKWIFDDIKENCICENFINH